MLSRGKYLNRPLAVWRVFSRSSSTCLGSVCNWRASGQVQRGRRGRGARRHQILWVLLLSPSDWQDEARAVRRDPLLQMHPPWVCAASHMGTFHAGHGISSGIVGEQGKVWEFNQRKSNFRSNKRSDLVMGNQGRVMTFCCQAWVWTL